MPGVLPPPPVAVAVAAAAAPWAVIGVSRGGVELAVGGTVGGETVE